MLSQNVCMATKHALCPYHKFARPQITYQGRPAAMGEAQCPPGELAWKARPSMPLPSGHRTGADNPGGGKRGGGEEKWRTCKREPRIVCQTPLENKTLKDRWFYNVFRTGAISKGPDRVLIVF